MIPADSSPSVNEDTRITQTTSLTHLCKKEKKKPQKKRCKFGAPVYSFSSFQASDEIDENQRANRTSGQFQADSSLNTSTQHSGQTQGMRKWVHFLAAAGQFPAQKFKENIGNNQCHAKFTKKN